MLLLLLICRLNDGRLKEGRLLVLLLLLVLGRCCRHCSSGCGRTCSGRTWMAVMDVLVMRKIMLAQMETIAVVSIEMVVEVVVLVRILEVLLLLLLLQ